MAGFVAQLALLTNWFSMLAVLVTGTTVTQNLPLFPSNGCKVSTVVYRAFSPLGSSSPSLGPEPAVSANTTQLHGW